MTLPSAHTARGKTQLRAQQHVTDAAHRTHTHCSISPTSIPAPALQRFLTSHSAPCPSSSALLRLHPSHFLGRTEICLKFPPSCQNANILDTLCNFSLPITTRIYINTHVPWSNKIYQEYLIPSFTLPPTFSLQPLSPEVPKTLTLRINYKAG